MRHDSGGSSGRVGIDEPPAPPLFPSHPLEELLNRAALELELRGDRAGPCPLRPEDRDGAANVPTLLIDVHASPARAVISEAFRLTRTSPSRTPTRTDKRSARTSNWVPMSRTSPFCVWTRTDPLVSSAGVDVDGTAFHSHHSVADQHNPTPDIDTQGYAFTECERHLPVSAVSRTGQHESHLPWPRSVKDWRWTSRADCEQCLHCGQPGRRPASPVGAA